MRFSVGHSRADGESGEGLSAVERPVDNRPVPSADGDPSPRESGDESPHSTARPTGAKSPPRFARGLRPSARCMKKLKLNFAPPSWLLLLVLVVLGRWAGPLSAAVGAVPGDAHTAAFFKEHCLRCHGPEKAKGDLRLDQVDTDLTKPSTFERWREIVARVQSGEMPPKKEARPAAAQVQAFVRQVSARLDEAAAKHRSDGRVVLRRLNRVEYENTVRDLFAVNVMVKEMLPEDAIAQGFDNVGAALNLSPVLMERYLEAADAVLTAALLPVHKLESKKERFDLYDSLPKWFANGVFKQADGVILFRGGATDLRQFKAPAPGRYRFRIAVSAHNSETPLPLGLLLGNFVARAL